ncbi:MAG: hypothetical protein H6Q65_1684 [Firmicutes bacterium]|nr:hypothetical protein [Bacillota bacterium]
MCINKNFVKLVNKKREIRFCVEMLSTNNHYVHLTNIDADNWQTHIINEWLKSIKTRVRLAE